MNQPEAVFHAESALRKSKGVWAENEIRFLGRLCVGSLSIGDTIRIPLVGGRFVETMVARFTEDLTDDWLGLPFYITVHAALEPFCICIDGSPVGQNKIKVPSLLEKHPDYGSDRAIPNR